MEQKGENMGGRKREIMLKFRVTEAERDMIYERLPGSRKRKRITHRI